MRRARLVTAVLIGFLMVTGLGVAGVRIEGVVFTEGPAEGVSVQVWALGAEVLSHPEKLTAPLYDAVAAPGQPFAVELEKARLPLWVQVAAKGHVALGMQVVLDGQTRLPPAFLRRGGAAVLEVRGPGLKPGGAVVWGTLSPDDWSEAPDRWRPVVPVTPVPKGGKIPVVLPEESGSADLVGVTASGRWGRDSRSRWRPGETAVLRLDSRALQVLIRDRKGKPAPGVLVAAKDAPRGAASRTDKDGRAKVQVAGRGSWTLVAVTDDEAGRLTGRGAGKKVTLDMEARADVELVWDPALGDLAVEASWLPEALGLTPVAAGGGSLRLLRPARTGRCLTWGPGVAMRWVAVSPTGGKAPLTVTPAVTVKGRVTRGGRPAPGLPVWIHLPSYFEVTGMMRTQVGRMHKPALHRPWLPWAVTSADGGFRVGGLPAGGVQAEVRAAGLPPARSARHDPKPGETVRLDLVLRPGVTVTLRTLNPDGDPVSGATVDVYRQAHKESNPGVRVYRFGPVEEKRGDPDATGMTDAEGRAAVTQAPAGTVRVVIRAEGFVTKTLRNIEAPEGEGADLGDVELEPSATLHGITVGPDGSPVGGAEVALSRTPGMPFFSPTVMSDEEGRFEIPGLERKGEVYLRARAEGYVPKPLKKVTLPPEGEVRVEMARERVLTGRVVEKGSGRPVAAATVMAGRLEKISVGNMRVRSMVSAGTSPTDAQGRFEIHGLADGRYRISVSAEGYRDAQQTLILEDAKETPFVTIEMERGLTLHGRVVDSSGAPVPGASVQAQPASLGMTEMVAGRQTVRTDAEGVFRLDGLATGRYTIKAQDDSGRQGSASAEAGSDEDVVVRLSDGATLRGRVVDEDGAPISGAEVGAFGMGMSPSGATTGPDGRFELKPVFPGSYFVGASAEGYAGKATQITVPEEGEPEEVTVTLHRGGVVTGRVVGLSAARMERLQIWCGNQSSGVDPQGRFRLDGVPFGTQQVVATLMPSTDRRSVTVEVPEDGTPAEVTIDFSQGATLSGRVTRSGQGLPGLVVTASEMAQSSDRTTVTGDDGDYRIEGLDPGEYQVAVQDASGQTLAGEHVVVEGDAVLDIELPTAEIHGWVLEQGTERPVAGATVTVTAAGLPAVEREVSSAEDGGFTLGDLPPGRVTVAARAQGYTPVQQPVTLNAGAPAEVTLRLTAEDVLRLRVHTAAGGVPSAVMVTFLAQGLVGNWLSASCDEEGLCPVRGLPAGPSTLKLTSMSGGMALVSAVLPGPEVRAVLRPAGIIRVTAPPDAAGVTWKVRIRSSETGLVLPVDRWKNPGAGEWIPVPTEGLSVGVPEGGWTVEALAPDGSSTQRQVQAAQGSPAEVRFGDGGGS